MKIISTIVAGLMGLCLHAQNVMVSFAGANRNRDYQVVIDGKSYYSANTTTSTNGRKTVTISDLGTGSHNLEVYEAGDNTSVYSDGASNAPVYGEAIYSKSFQLRSGYDMNINVRGNGLVSFSEKPVKNDIQYGRNVTPVSNAAFTQLVQNVKAKRYQSQKISLLQNAFNTTTNYFTATQIKQLLLLISSESSRLTLAKLSFSRVADPGNFVTVYDAFSVDTNKDALDDYVVSKGGIPNSITTSENNAAYVNRSPMTDASFNQLYQKAQNHFFQDNTVQDIRSALNISSNYFTTAQIQQLLSLVTSETSRLELAKLAYSHATDPYNFSQVVNMMSSQGSRDELNSFIGTASNTSSNSNSGYTSKSAMTEATFNQIYQKARNHFFQSSVVTDVRNAFSASANYFTTQQVRQLLLLVKGETDRLTLAKLAYTRAVDTANFSLLADLFTLQANKDEFNNYIRTQKY